MARLLSQDHFSQKATTEIRGDTGSEEIRGQTDLEFPEIRGQTDLEFLVEKILNRPDPQGRNADQKLWSVDDLTQEIGVQAALTR